MIRRAVFVELAGLWRSPALAVTTLFAVGGAVLGRAAAWIGAAVAQSEVSEILAFAGISATDVSVPLAVLAYVLAAGYLFGRDFNDQTVEVLLTSPVRRESFVAAKLAVLLAWVTALAVLAVGADAATTAILAAAGGHPGDPVVASVTCSVALAAFATLPVVCWLAIRMQGSLLAVGVGIFLHVFGMSVSGIPGAEVLPWNAPFAAATGQLGGAAIAVASVVFISAVLACVWEIRRVDLV